MTVHGITYVEAVSKYNIEAVNHINHDKGQIVPYPIDIMKGLALQAAITPLST